ncbi:MAG: choice-of-anchor D domain-containing protein [Burkholderiales bacterium]
MSIYSTKYIAGILACVSTLAFGIPLGNLDKHSLFFELQAVNSISAPKLVTLSNTGNTTLTIDDMKVSPEFSLGDPCFTEGILCFRKPDLPCTSIEPGKGCTFNVWYMPQTKPGRSGSVRFYSNLTGSPHSVTLLGVSEIFACPATVLVVQQFPDTAIGAVNTETKSFTIKNFLQTDLLLAVHASGDFFVQPAPTTTCGINLTANQTCTVAVSFHPTVIGDRSGYVSYTNDDLCNLGGQFLKGNGTGNNINNPAAPGTPVNPAFGYGHGPKVITAGCTIGKNNSFDPALLLLVMGAMLRLYRKKIQLE